MDADHSDGKMKISADSPLIFMHLPKTGGMSLFTSFSEIWKTSIADLYDVSQRNVEISAKSVVDRNKALYCGHYAFGLHEWLDRPAYYASVMREPVERVVSLYHYCQPKIRDYAKLLKKVGGDISVLRKDKQLSDYYFDFLPCMTGELNAENFFASPSAELDNGMVRRFSGYGLNPEKCPDSALDQAKANIDNYFSVVGLLERFPETLTLLETTFALPVLAKNHVNRNLPASKTIALEDHIMAKIREMNRLDIELYEWVSQRFDAQLAAPRAILVPGQGRKDSESMPLWLGVGNSPLRESVMKDGGLRNKPNVKPVLCRKLARLGVKAETVVADIDTIIQLPGEKAKGGDRLRLIMTPKMAKELAEQLGKALELVNKNQGAVH